MMRIYYRDGSIGAQVIEDIAAERSAQDAQHGGRANDDRNSYYDWVKLICYQLDRGRYEQPVEVRQRMVKIAALAIAALESYDRTAQYYYTADPNAPKS